MQKIRGRLTYANVTATIALFVALGGVSYAATQLPKNSVGSKQIKNNAVTGAKIANGAVTGAKIQLSSLGTVPSAATAGSSDTAKHATAADTAESAKTAATAGTADNANALGGVPAASYARTQLEAVHYVDQPGQPVFENGCGNLAGTEFEPVGFYKDNSGIVHLTGVANSCSTTAGNPIFTLPVGFRPRKDTLFAGAEFGTTNGSVRADPDGGVKNFGVTEIGLNGDTFRAE